MSLLDDWEENVDSNTTSQQHSEAVSRRNPFLADTEEEDIVSSRNPFAQENVRGIRTVDNKPINPFAEDYSLSSSPGPSPSNDQSQSRLNPFAEDMNESFESYGNSRTESLDKGSKRRGLGVRGASTDSLFSLENTSTINSITEDTPQFHLQNVDVGASAGRTLKTLTSGGDLLFMAMETAEAVSIYVWNGNASHQLNLPLKSGENVNLFADALGRHVLISVDNGDNYYYNATKLKTLPNSMLMSKMQHHALKVKGPLKALRNVVIESVSFDKQSCNDVSAVALLGSKTGEIYEATIGEQKCKEKHIKRIYNLIDTIPICGLKCERFPVVDADSTKQKWFVMAVTARPTRYYQFVGGPTFEEMFSKYSSPEQRMFVELPSNLTYSQLHCYTKYLEQRAKSFTVLTGAGIFHGTLSFGSQESGEEVVKVYDMLSFPSETKDGCELTDPPLSMEETEFHFVLLYPSWLLVVSKLNESIVFEKNLSEKETGLTLGLCRDSSSESIWIYSSFHVLRLNIENEDGNAWRLYLEKAEREGSGVDFNTALNYAKNDQQRDMVLTVQANYYFNTNNFELAARYYAESSRSFEEVSLMLLAQGQKDALKSYLMLKLKALPVEAKTQKTILCVWITDIFLDKLNSISKRELLDFDFSDSDNDEEFEIMDIQGTKNTVFGQLSDPADTENNGEEEHKRVQQEFWKFLQTYQTDLDPAKETIFNMISSHGRVDELVFYAKLIEDYDRVITYHMQRGDYDKAIDVLLEQSGNLSSSRSAINAAMNVNSDRSHNSQPPLSDMVQQLFYKYSPVLMEHCPEATVDAWIEAQFLDPCKLIPALVRYTQQKNSTEKSDDVKGNGQNQNQAIRYLEYCVKDNGNTDEAIHNYLVSLYASDDEAEEQLLEFVQWPGSCFDKKYALRICTEKNRKRVCVHIYSSMHLYEEAVDLALSVDIDLAKENANKAEDMATKKLLWVKIARSVIEKDKQETRSEGVNSTQNVSKALEILHESEVLRIEDIMVYFSDFVKIDEFKEEICASLEEYNANIEQLKAEMNDFTKTAGKCILEFWEPKHDPMLITETIRSEIEEQNLRFDVIPAAQLCDLCGTSITSSSNVDSILNSINSTWNALYIFPCTHAFHAGCLLDEVSRHLRDDQRAHVEIFRRALEQQQQRIQQLEHSNENDAEFKHKNRSVEMSKAEREAETMLHEFLSAACPFCGDLMIESIAAPFITHEEQEEAKQWQI